MKQAIGHSPEMAMFKVNATQVLHYFSAEDLGHWFVHYFTPNVYLIGTILFVILFYWMFYVPYNLKKSLDDAGYDMALGPDRKVNDARKKDAINRIRRARKIGVHELPPPYPNGWYSIIESEELAKGQAKSVSCLGEIFVVYRTDKNAVYVLDAYCPHMGANMGIGGRVIGDNVECPFHKWSFSGIDGKCVDVPYVSCAPGAKVRKWISREVNGNIFVWYHREEKEIPWELPTVEEISTKEFIYHGRNEFYVNCHIQEIPENGADLAHFSALHRASLLAGGQNPKDSLLQDLGAHHWAAIWKPSDSAKHLATISLKHSVQLTRNIRFFEINVDGLQIGPSFVQLHLKFPTFGRMEMLQTITPIEPLVQKVVHRFYAPRALAPFVKFFVIGESIMFQRDVNIWNHKMFRNKPLLVKEDTLIKTFRTWYSQFYSENSKTYAQAVDNFDW